MSFKSENMGKKLLSVEELAKKEANKEYESGEKAIGYPPFVKAFIKGHSSRDEEVAELVKALNYCSDILDGLINRTPTGDERNQLCDNNIHIKTLLLKY